MQMEKAGITLRKLDLDAERLASPSTSEIDELAERSQKLEQRVSALNDSYETLKKREGNLTEWRWVLREAGGFFDRGACCGRSAAALLAGPASGAERATAGRGLPASRREGWYR